MKNRGKQERSRDTITTLLEAATQVLIEQGYERATTNRIAERSGFSVGTLYQYFENKEDLFEELVTLELQRIVGAVEQCEPCSTLDGTVAKVLAEANAALSKHPGETQALAPLLAGPFSEQLQRSRERVITAMSELLTAHRDEIQAPDMAMAARVVVNTAEGFAMSASPEHFPPTDMEQQLVRLILAYLTAPQDP